MAWYPRWDGGGAERRGGARGAGSRTRGRETLTSPILAGSGGEEAREEFPAGRAWCHRLALSDRCYPSLAVCLGLLAPMGRTHAHRIRVVVAETLQAVRLKVWRWKAVPPPVIIQPPSSGAEWASQARQSKGEPGQSPPPPPRPSLASCCGSQASPSFALKPEITSFLVTPNCRKMKCRRV